jgi:hypothetical protein
MELGLSQLSENRKDFIHHPTSYIGNLIFFFSRSAHLHGFYEHEKASVRRGANCLPGTEALVVELHTAP